MPNVTVQCGCGRVMRVVGNAPRGTYACGCGARVLVTVADNPRCTGLSAADRQCGFPPVRESADLGLSLCRDHLAAYDEALEAVRAAGGLPEHYVPAMTPAEWLAEMGQLRAAESAATPEEDRRLKAYEAQSVVYYVRIRDLIKIGTTVNMQARFGQLIVDEILATEPGARPLEQMRHKQFAHLRVRGERFAPGPDLDSHIAMLREHYGEPVMTGYLCEDGRPVRAARPPG